jgi:hypothetical protein
MDDAAEEEASEGDVDYGLGAVDALLLVAHETAPAGHPSEGALDNPATGKNFEALRGI